MLTSVAIVAPDYPACLTGSKRYACNLVTTWTNADGTTGQSNEQTKHRDRQSAIAYARTVAGTVQISD